MKPTSSPRHYRSRLRRAARGFTLVEMVVSASIVCLLMGMVIEFNVETIKSMYISEDKCDINRDMRQLTMQMSDDARMANFFVLYSNYTASSRASASQELGQANSGDFLVLVFYGNATNGNTGANFNVRPVEEIVGYYRAPYQPGQSAPITNAPTSQNLEPVRRFVYSVSGIAYNGMAADGTIPANSYLETSNVPAGGNTTTLEALLPPSDSTTISNHAIVVQLAQGLADQCLFHNFWGKSVMINGQIVHGNNNTSATDTYNFTISPRG